MKKIQTVTIIGVGLIGGSLGMSLLQKKIVSNIIGFGRDSKKLEVAKKQKAITSYTTDLEEALRYSDIIVIAVPVKLVPLFIDRCNLYAKKGAIIIDVASTKKEIVDYARAHLLKELFFVGCHPFAGSEKSGIFAAQKNLYVNKICIITKTSNTNLQKLKLIQQMWEAIGAIVVVMTTHQHDKIASETSHVPHIIASCLVDAFQYKYSQYIATGFKDTTRIAESDATMWTDICLSNTENIISGIDTYIKTLEKWKKTLLSKKEKPLKTLFLKTSEKRKKIT